MNEMNNNKNEPTTLRISLRVVASKREYNRI